MKPRTSFARPDVARLKRHVAARIAEIRRTQGWTQEVLAERLGVSLRYMQSVEAGTQNLTLETIAKVATALRISAVQLFIQS